MAQRILIADPSLASRRRLARMLEPQGFDVWQVEDGKVAADLAKLQTFDMIIAEYEMPGRDAIELSQTLRATPEHANTPIFVISSESTPALIRDGKREGVSAWFVRPIRPQMVVGAVSLALGRGAARRKRALTKQTFDAQRTMRQRVRGFTLIELMVVVAILGILAVVAITAGTKYTKRVKTSEAKTSLAKMFDGTAAYYLAEHNDAGSVQTIGDGGKLDKTAMHRCPHKNNKKKGQAALTPKKNKRCAKGPGGRCIPGVDAGGGGFYDMALWTDNDIWNGLNFQMEQGHYFHYNFRFRNDLKGYGSCQFTAQAFGDLDDDKVFSTFERAGAADINGVNGAAGLYIDQDLE